MDRDNIIMLLCSQDYPQYMLEQTADKLENMGATDKPCGGGLSTLTQNRCQTIHEERNVPDSFYLCSETFYL